VASRERREKIEENDNAETQRARSFRREGGAPTSRVFAYEWQAKDLRDRECVRVAGKGLTGVRFCASRARRESDGELGGVATMVRRGERIGVDAERCVGTDVEERRGELRVGEGCAAVMAQDTRLVN
jgi:hypothetical protein